MWPEKQVSRVPGEVEHQETLFVMFFTKKSALKCFKLVYSLMFYVYCSRNKYHLSTYSNVA